MAKKLKHHPRSALPIHGWVLVSLGEDDWKAGTRKGPWGICWYELFGTRSAAIEFARSNNWHIPYRAVRGEIRVSK